MTLLFLDSKSFVNAPLHLPISSTHISLGSALHGVLIGKYPGYVPPKSALFHSYTHFVKTMLLSIPLRFALSLAVLGQPTAGFSVPRSDYRLGVRQYQENDKLGAVASESSVCSQIGVGLIKAGGNAADAVCLPLWH